MAVSSYKEDVRTAAEVSLVIATIAAIGIVLLVWPEVKFPQALGIGILAWLLVLFGSISIFSMAIPKEPEL